MCFSLSTYIQCKSVLLTIPRSTNLGLSRSESSWTRSPDCTPFFRCIVDIEKCDEECIGRGLPVLGDKDISERSDKAMSKHLSRNVKIDWCDACERWNEEREEREQERWNEEWKERVRESKGKGKEREEEDEEEGRGRKKVSWGEAVVIGKEEKNEDEKVEWEMMRVVREEEARAWRIARDKDRDWEAAWGNE